MWLSKIFMFIVVTVQSASSSQALYAAATQNEKLTTTQSAELRPFISRLIWSLL